MECENIFCIYYKKGRCKLKEVTLDIQGKCNDCVYVEIEEDELERLRNIIADRE